MKQKSLEDGDGKEEEESRCELEREECKEKMPKLLCLLYSYFSSSVFTLKWAQRT